MALTVDYYFAPTRPGPTSATSASRRSRDGRAGITCCCRRSGRRVFPVPAVCRWQACAAARGLLAARAEALQPPEPAHRAAAEVLPVNADDAAKADHRGRHARRQRGPRCASPAASCAACGWTSTTSPTPATWRACSGTLPAGAAPRRLDEPGRAPALRAGLAARRRRRRVRRASYVVEGEIFWGQDRLDFPATKARQGLSAMRRLLLAMLCLAAGQAQAHNVRGPDLRRPPALQRRGPPKARIRLPTCSGACSAAACAPSSPTAGPTMAQDARRREMNRRQRPA